jgi:hypothetical protein
MRKGYACIHNFRGTNKGVYVFPDKKSAENVLFDFIRDYVDQNKDWMVDPNNISCFQPLFDALENDEVERTIEEWEKTADDGDEEFYVVECEIEEKILVLA